MVPRVWCRRNGLLQVFVFFSSVVIAGSTNTSPSNSRQQYRLVPPEVYVVFGDDLHMQFHVPGDVSLPNAFVQLQGQRPRDEGWTEVTTMGLPLTRKTGTLTVACGIVEFAGRYSLTLVMQVDGPVLARATFTSVWPSLALRLPDRHTALTSSVTMEIQSRAQCSSRLQREFLMLELFYQRFEDSGSPSLTSLSNVERVTAANFTAVNKPSFGWNYACKVFQLDGYYQAALRSSSGTTLTVSNVMTSTFSDGYLLTCQRSSVFPCEEGDSVSVFYTHPSCAAGLDRIRVYRLVRRVPGSTAAPVERIYMTELQVHPYPNKTRVDLGCQFFEESEAGAEAEEDKRGSEVPVGFCWVYVTVTSSGVVVEHKQLCLPAWSGAVLPQDGAWSSWTAWTTCSVTCGSGKRSRFRICNSPVPDYGGRHCSGQPMQWFQCIKPCPDVLPRSPLRSPQFDPDCLCGCTRALAADSEPGELIASGRCPGLATWIIKATGDRKQRVTLTFRYFSISYEKQWVKVRDGGTESDDLLFYSRHHLQQQQQQQPPGDVISSSNVMRVELMTEADVTSPVHVTVYFTGNATMPIHVQGFIASYTVTAPDAAQLPPPLHRHEDASVLESHVTIVGLVVVGVVAVVVIVFAVAQRKYCTRMRRSGVKSKTSQRYSPAAKIEEEGEEGGEGEKGGAGNGTLGHTGSGSGQCAGGARVAQRTMAGVGVVEEGDSVPPALVFTRDGGSRGKSSSDQRLASKNSSLAGSVGNVQVTARAHGRGDSAGSTPQSGGKARAHSGTESAAGHLAPHLHHITRGRPSVFDSEGRAYYYGYYEGDQPPAPTMDSVGHLWDQARALRLDSSGHPQVRSASHGAGTTAAAGAVVVASRGAGRKREAAATRKSRPQRSTDRVGSRVHSASLREESHHGEDLGASAASRNLPGEPKASPGCYVSEASPERRGHPSESSGYAPVSSPAYLSPSSHSHYPSTSSPNYKPAPSPSYPSTSPSYPPAFSPDHPSAPSPAGPSPTKQELLLMRKRRKKKGTSAHHHHSPGRSRGDRDGRSSCRVSSSTNPDAPEGRQVTTKADINFTHPATALTSEGVMTSEDLNDLPTSRGGSERAPTDVGKESRGSRRDTGRRRSDHGKGLPREHVPLVPRGVEEEPRGRLLSSRVSGPPSSALCEETSFVSSTASKVQRPISVTREDAGSSKQTGAETVLAADTNPKRSKPRTKPDTDCVRRATAAGERETLLPSTRQGERSKSLLPSTRQGERSKSLEQRAREKDERVSGSCGPSKSSGVVPTKSVGTVAQSSRSVAIPELEYDHFVLDDPQPHSQYEDLSRLNWSGTEKVADRTRPRDHT